MPNEKDHQDDADEFDENDDLDNEGDDSEDESDDDSGSESGASEKEADSKESQDSDDAAAKYKKRMQAADRRAAAAEKRLKEIEDAGKTDSEKLQGERDEAIKWRATNEPVLAQLRLENAFLKTNELSWQNAGVAMSVARDGGYLDDAIDEDTGEIDAKALKVALSKLAKDHEYLVRKRRNSSSGTSGASGEPGPEGGKGTRNDKKSKDASLRRRLPALGSR